MLSNYFKIAFRNLLRSKSFSAINILGLSVGLTCCLLLLLYIRSELSFDRHHRNANDLYLLKYSIIKPGESGTEPFVASSAPYAFALKQEYPEIEQVTRLWVNILDSKTLLQVREGGKALRSFYETGGYHVDSTFFDLFSYQFTEGDSRGALADPTSVVLSEEMAHKLFGNAPALHRLVRIGGSSGAGRDYRVSGVYRDESGRSHIDARFFLPMSAGWTGTYLREAKLDFCCNNMFFTYLRLRPGTDPDKLTKKLPAFIEKYARQDLKAAGFDKQFGLVAAADIHLYDSINTIVTPTNSRMYLYILASIALFTLLIACINFMNLSTARSVRRATEVGIRKVMGAGQRALMGQFLSESMLLALLALAIAIGLVAMLMPFFNELTGRQLSVRGLFDLHISLAVVGLAVLTGLVAGSYPAFYLSMFNPVRVLKGRLGNTLSAVALRRFLVVFQFVVSVGLVLATLVIGEQIKYMRTKSLGFAQDQQLVVPLRTQESEAIYTAYRNEVLRNNQVLGAAGTQYYQGIENPTDYGLYRAGQSVRENQIVKTNWVDVDYLQTMGFRLVAGRMFSRQFPGDTANRMVVNEATLRKLNIPRANAIGQKLNFDWHGQTQQYEIVGVLKDFHFEDLHKPIEPYTFLLNSQASYNYLIVHINTTDMGNVLADLKKKWTTLRPDEPFEYSFLNDDFQRNYQAEARMARIVGTFTFLSILISCLGLFGLAAFAAQQRTKEIGVRKVLGASVGSIVALLSKDFLKLVVLAILIASPLAWWTMRQWLQEFAYRISIPWWVFATAGATALLIAFLTVSFQSIRAALMNPVKSLRAE